MAADIKAGFIAHPSWVEEDELKKASGPIAIAAAQNDDVFPADKRHQSEEILIATGNPFQINLYSGVSHGFAIRADLKVQVERYAKEQAFEQAVSWFNEHL